MNLEYSDIKSKEVVNILDGKKLGKTINLLIDIDCGKIRGIIVPGEKGISFFKSNDDIYIPWQNIKRIGDDVILVEIPADVRTLAIGGGEKVESDHKQKE